MAARPLAQNSKKLAKFTELNNLCSERNGAKILFATDDWFAAAENMLKETDAEWKEGVYDDFGKWMDGWETRRKRIPGHDFCIVQLANPGIIHGVDVDTSYFTGNYTPKFSLLGANLKSLPPSFEHTRDGQNGKAASPAEFQNVQLLKSEEWQTLIPKMKLGAGYADTCHNYVEVESRETWTHLRLNMFPDGGIARFRVYGQVQRSLEDIVSGASAESDLIDLVAMENGGICLGYSDAHYGHPRNIIVKEEPENMGQGWETARRLDRPEILTADSAGILQVPGNEWSVFRLGVPGVVHQVQVDTTHYKGNYPAYCLVEAATSASSDGQDDLSTLNWTNLIERQKLGPDQKHYFETGSQSVITHVRVTMAPDGGLARVRLWGKPRQL